MSSVKAKDYIILSTLILSLVLAGCSATPDEEQLSQWKKLEGPGEMKPGAGLFSGDDGEFTIYNSKKGGFLPKEDQTASNQPAAQSAAAAESGSRGSSQAVPVSDKAGDFQEFQEFQQWQQEKEQFHEYQQWKNSTRGSADFKEYQEYRQWQKSAKGSADYRQFQEYQKWKKGARNSADYKEFLEWKEFKAYQEWKKSQP